MQFQSQGGKLILCHKAEGCSYNRTHYLCRVRGHVLRDDLSLEADARGYNGILVLQPSNNPQLAKFFSDSVDTLVNVQKTLNIPEGRLINAIHNVDGQQRLTLIAMSTSDDSPLRVKDTQGDIIAAQKDKLALKGLDIDVVFTFYHTRILIKNPGKPEPELYVLTIARLSEVQILFQCV
ncbi:hypothetical protein BDN72DRAFT_901582 [Pluteus cervinus]|uniref:Uncharacterized protein n=1 Tax=Pluteus cervinus TaxID=181527 RepID=A0ACD3AG65_9AGAR|nr:hypothetical protein BDN72DRAFT_901582 [Pluteus cervinus]